MNETFAPRRTAPWRTRCAISGTSLRRFEPTTSTPAACSISAMAQPSMRRDRIVRLVAEIDATQAMVEVVRAESARDLRRQREFFERRDRRRQHADLGRTCLAHDLLQALGRRFERSLPVDFAPGAALLDHRLHGAVGRVKAFAAEAVAIGDPGLVDRFVRARHDAHDPAAQHVRAQVGADAIVRRHERRAASFPRRGRGTGTACCSARRPGTGR